jgi:hypothetical protein
VAPKPERARLAFAFGMALAMAVTIIAILTWTRRDLAAPIPPTEAIYQPVLKGRQPTPDNARGLSTNLRRIKSGLATCRPTGGVISYRRALLLGQDHEVQAIVRHVGTAKRALPSSYPFLADAGSCPGNHSVWKKRPELQAHSRIRICRPKLTSVETFGTFDPASRRLALVARPL